MNQLFNWDLNALSKNQKKIANFVENNIKKIPYLTEQKIADELKISVASVSRFWRVMGYHNFKDFKLSLFGNLEINPALKMQSFINKVDGDDLPANMLELGVQYLIDTSIKLSRDDFNRAIQAIVKARHIHILAPGISKGLAELLQFRLKRYGLLVSLVEKGGNELFETLMHLNHQDLVIVFAFSSISPEAKVILDFSKEINYKTLFLTDFLVSEVLDQANIVLYAYRGQMWEFHSMVAPTVLVESLIVGVGKENQNATIEKLDYLNHLRKKYSAIFPK